jgi:hypothetical protein
VPLTACKDPADPSTQGGAAAACNPIGSWHLAVTWTKGKQTCDLITEGEGMRIWVNKGWDGSLEVRKGSKLGDSAIEASLLEAKDCNFVLTATSDGREEDVATVVMTMKQTGTTAKGTATYDRKSKSCHQDGTVEAEKL